MNEVVLAPKNSILFLGDRDEPLDVPEITDRLVASTSTCIAIGTLAEVDGETTVQLMPKISTPVGDMVFQGTLETPSRALSVSDSEGLSVLSLDVPTTRTWITIWANDWSEPDLIQVQAEAAS